MNAAILSVFGIGGGELLLVLMTLLLLVGVLVAGAASAAYFVIRSLRQGSPPPPVAQRPAPKTVTSEATRPSDIPATEHANLAGSRFQDVNLSGADFDNVNLANARFHNVNLSNVTITAAQMGGAALKHVGPPPDSEGKQERQRPVRFEEMMLCDSTFRKVDLSNVRVADCDLAGMTIDGILVTELIAVYRNRAVS
jgi:hypothetical protein